jgi:5-aminopentanamidase
LAIHEHKHETITVASAQLAPVFGDVDHNRALASDAIAAAAEGGANVVVLPELCTTGYAFADQSEALEFAEPADGPTVAAWRELAARHGIVIVGGFCERDRAGRPRNSAAVLDPGGVRCVYRKAHLWDREQLIFVAGSEPAPVIETTACVLGVAICYDSFFPEMMRALAVAGAELIAVPMNSPVLDAPTAPLPIEAVLALASAHVNSVFVAQADRSGRERGFEWAQASVICDPGGHLLAGPVNGTAVLQAECNLAHARDKSFGVRNDLLADRRPELYTASRRVSTTKTTKETVN